MNTTKQRTSVQVMPFETVNAFERQIVIALRDTKHVQEKDKTALALEILDALHETQTTVLEIPKEHIIY